MRFGKVDRRLLAGTALAGFMLAAAGCQSNDVLGSAEKGDMKPDAAKPTASSLQAYCPKVTLRAGTAYYNTYGKGGKKSAADAAAGDDRNDSSNIVYQAAITDVTRDCARANGAMTINVAVAGKVVPGPLAKPAAITMPIRIVVLHGKDVLYSKLSQYKLQISDLSAATQFVFSDPNITVPEPTASDYQVFAGYDEGPPAAAKPRKKKHVARKPPPVTAAKPAPAPAQTSISDIPR